MAEQIILPRQGQSVETCLILSWKKKEGDEVALGEILVEVETDKATFEVESTAAGILLNIRHQEGEDVPVLSPLAIVGEAGESIAAQAGTARAESQPVAEAVTEIVQPPPAAAPASTPGVSAAAAARGKVPISPRA